MGKRFHIPFYRRQYIVNSKFQFTFIGYILGFAILAMTVFYVAQTVLFWNMLEKAQSNTLSPEYVRQSLDTLFIVTLIVTIAVLSIGGVLLSHKVAGPLYRLKNHMLDVAYGKTLNETGFRSGDFFHELADSFNKVITRYREETEKNQRLLKAIRLRGPAEKPRK